MAPQIVLMTGCSSGIGLATAKRLALDQDQRYIVIATVVAMSEKTDLEAAVGDALNNTVFIQKLDITKDDDIETVVGSTVKSYGKIDILINVAGIGVADIAEKVPREQIEQIFNVNVFGTMRLTQAVVPEMKRRRAGKIVTISSVCGKIAWPYIEMYCSTKFALEGFFEGLAVALRSFGIRVCLIEPGGTDTGIVGVFSSGLSSRLNDDSIDDVDRHQLQCMKEALTTSVNATADGTAEAIATRCLDVNEPVLRHFLPEEFHEPARAGLGDLTGETMVAFLEKTFGK